MRLLEKIESKLIELQDSVNHPKKYEARSEKVFIIGNSGVGKSAFIKILTNQAKKEEAEAPDVYKPTVLPEADSHQLQRKKKSGQSTFTQTVTTILWEIPGNINLTVNSLTEHIAEANVMMIFITSRETDLQNQQNISNWLKFIRENKLKHNAKIILVENCDDNNAIAQLRSETIAALQTKNISYVAISPNTKLNFDKLEDIIWATVEQNVPQIKQDKDEWQLSVTYDERWPRQQRVKHRIDQLENKVAKCILKSVDRVLSSGTKMSSKNAYNLSIFGGGILTTKCLGITQKVLTYINYMQEVIHYQVPQEPESLVYAKLKLVFLKSEEAAKADHFSRKANTQIFYDKTIPTFIDKVLEPDNLKLFDDIDKLSQLLQKIYLCNLKRSYY